MTAAPAFTGKFQLDTSGVVRGPFNATGYLTFDDLDPFTQGYVEAALTAAWSDDQFRSRWLLRDVIADLPEDQWRTAPLGFSDLAPETLARIVEDCAGWLILYPKTGGGQRFWELRNLQLVKRPDFPPLTPYLGDDGKVYLRDAAVSA